MGQKEIIGLNDIVDTLKLQFYPNDNTTQKEKDKFNSLIEEFVLLKQEAMAIKHHDQQKRFVKTKVDNTTFKVMATSKGSFNVVLQNGDIDISLLKISSTHSNPVVKVEFRAEFLLRNGYKIAIELVKDIINTFFENYNIKVSEIHLAKDIQGYEFTPYDFHRIKTLSKTKEVFSNDVSSEYYFGNRFTGFSIGKGHELLRIYNKTIEIAKKKEKAFISVLSWEYNPDFDPTQNVWRLEFQLRRSRLKELLGDYGLLDSLDNVIRSITRLWAYCVNRFVHKNLTPKQVNEQMTQTKFFDDGTFEYLSSDTLRKRFQRAETSNLWDSIQSFENKQAPALQRIKDIKKPEVEYVKNAIKAVISTYIKVNRGNFDSEELTSIFISADKEVREKYGISLIDKARLNTLDYIVKANAFYNHTGIIEDSFRKYKKDFLSNLNETYAILENEPTNLITFREFNKQIRKFRNTPSRFQNVA